MDTGPTPLADALGERSRRSRHTIPLEAVIKRVRTIGSCKLATFVNMPSYSSYGSALKLTTQPNGNGGANRRTYGNIEKWYDEDLTVDGSPFWGGKVPDLADPEKFGGSTGHVWEKSNIADFIGSLLRSGPNDFDCDDLNALFFLPPPRPSLLQQIYNQLPSMDTKNVVTGFAFMAISLNGMKGWMFKLDYKDTLFNTIYKPKDDEALLQAIERQAIIFDLFNTDSGYQLMHDQTNNRIYQAFLGLDNYIAAHNIQRPHGRGNMVRFFGPVSRTWYSGLLSNTSSEAWYWADRNLRTAAARAAAGECETIKRAVDTLENSPLFGQAQFQIDQSHLTWDVTASLALGRRDLSGPGGLDGAPTTLSAPLALDLFGNGEFDGVPTTLSIITAGLYTSLSRESPLSPLADSSAETVVPEIVTVTTYIR